MTKGTKIGANLWFRMHEYQRHPAEACGPSASRNDVAADEPLSDGFSTGVSFADYVIPYVKVRRSAGLAVPDALATQAVVRRSLAEGERLFSSGMPAAALPHFEAAVELLRIGRVEIRWASATTLRARVHYFAGAARLRMQNGSDTVGGCIASDNEALAHFRLVPPFFERLPLPVAAAKGHEDVVTFLLHHGADVDAVGVGGETALRAASSRGHASIAQLLRARPRRTLWQADPSQGTDNDATGA